MIVNKHYVNLFKSLFYTAIVLILFIAKKEQVQFITKYGQTLKIVLPDSSTVYLNGNSKLSYINNWDNNSDREESISKFSLKVKSIASFSSAKESSAALLTK